MLNYRMIILTFTLVIGNTTVHAAGFNCSNEDRLKEVERLICNDKELSKADSTMSKGYYSLLNVLPKSEVPILQDDQKLWLQARDDELDNCLRVGVESAECRGLYEYAKRIAQLGPPKEISFDCEKATHRAEKKICSSRLLRHADGVLAKLYKGFKDDFKDSQQEWLKERNDALGDSSCDTRCAWEFLKDRIAFFVHQSF
jgi:uncharacterized protein